MINNIHRVIEYVTFWGFKKSFPYFWLHWVLVSAFGIFCCSTQVSSLFSVGALTPEYMGPVVVTHRLSCPIARGLLVPQPGIEPTSPALEGGFLTTGCGYCSVAPWTVATRLLCPWNFPGKNIGVGSHSLLQGIFPIQGLNPSPLHCSQILYLLSHKGPPVFYTWHNCLEGHPKYCMYQNHSFSLLSSIPWKSFWKENKHSFPNNHSGLIDFFYIQGTIS